MKVVVGGPEIQRGPPGVWVWWLVLNLVLAT